MACPCKKENTTSCDCLSKGNCNCGTDCGCDNCKAKDHKEACACKGTGKGCDCGKECKCN